jgi:hypothetical protein
VRWSLVLVALVSLAGVAWGHQSSTKYLEVTTAGDRATLVLRFAPGDVTEPMGLAPDAKPAPTAAAVAPNVPAYVASWVAVRLPSGGCTAGAGSARAEPDGFVAVTWPVTCARPIETLVLDFSAFFALDRKMEIIVTVDDAGARRVTAAESPVVVELARAPVAAGLRAALAPERLAFALLIVLVAVIGTDRRPVAFGVALRVVGIALAGYALADLVGVLGWIAVPARLGIAAVAATLVYAGAEVAARPDARWRTLTVVAFGVVHGIAHAGAPPATRLVASGAALAFAIVVLLPLVHVAVAGLGAERYRRRLLPILAGAVGAGGLVWLAWTGFGT